jgi:hypothetical protein
MKQFYFIFLLICITSCRLYAQIDFNDTLSWKVDSITFKKTYLKGAKYFARFEKDMMRLYKSANDSHFNIFILYVNGELFIEGGAQGCGGDNNEIYGNYILRNDELHFTIAEPVNFGEYLNGSWKIIKTDSSSLSLIRKH